MTKDIIIAGQAAEGSGALIGWNGRGTATRPKIINALESAGLPASWAPKSKSAQAQAGQATRPLNNLGYIVRRDKRGDYRNASTLTWDARWIVSKALSSSAKVGDAAGEVVATFELRGDELTADQDSYATLAIEVIQRYEALRDDEVYQAGEVTQWLANILMNECGATRFGNGYYVPKQHRTRATKLAKAAFLMGWGCGWIYPLLPVASCEELRQGIARGLEEDIASLADSLESARKSATEAGKSEVQPGVAAAILRNLVTVSERLMAYQPLCGSAVLERAVISLGKLRTTLESLCDATSQRGAMLDIPSAAEVAPKRVPASEGLMNKILDCTTLDQVAKLIPELRKVPEGGYKNRLREAYRKMQRQLIETYRPKPPPVVTEWPICTQPAAPVAPERVVEERITQANIDKIDRDRERALEPSDADIRFSLLELE